jgi:hypothetical protein
MLKLILILKAVALACLSALLLSLTIASLQVREAVIKSTLPQNAQNLVLSAQKTLDGVNGSLLAKDAKDKQQRTAVQEILDNAAGISRLAYHTTAQQQKYWDDLPTRTTATLDKFNLLVDDIQGRGDKVLDNAIALTSADGPVSGILAAFKQDLVNFDGTLSATTQIIKDLDANLANSPEVRESLTQITAILKNGNGVSSDLLKMADDSQVKYHQLLFAKPSLKQRILLGLDIVYKLALIRAAGGF